MHRDLDEGQNLTATVDEYEHPCKVFEIWSSNWLQQFDALRFNNDNLLDDLIMHETWILGRVFAYDERGYSSNW